MLKFIVIEPTDKQAVFIVSMEDAAPVRIATHDVGPIKAAMARHGIPGDQVLVICGKAPVAYMLCDILEARPVRLSPAWSTGSSFGHRRRETYINSHDKPADMSACEWVVEEYKRYLVEGR